MQNNNMMEINGVMVDVTTVMDKSVQYKPDATYALQLMERVEDLLHEYFDFEDNYGIHKMFNQSNGVFWERKGWIIKAMEKIPGYNGNLQIILKGVDLHRYTNLSDMRKFRDYVCDWEERMVTYKDKKGNTISGEEGNKLLGKLARMRYHAGRRGLYVLYEKIHDEYDRLENTMTRNKNAVFMREVVTTVFDMCADSPEVLSEDAVEAVKKCAKDILGIEYKHVAPGQKMSKFISKLGRFCGITNDVRIETVRWEDQATGELRERQKDMGWNQKYAMLADATNPLTFKGTIVISVNAYDYLTQSFGWKWASCMTIDKENRRRADNNYHGMYCGGTLSYMNDTSTIVVYTIPDDYEGDRPETLDKIKRCLFHIGEDKLVQGRVYPDGRDGGDKTLAGDMRAVVQKVVAQMFDVPNYWTVAHGTEPCCEVVESEGVHYKDYEHYDDCSVSYMKRIDGYKNVKRITIGSPSICPACGKEHYTEDNPFCCKSAVRCAECGCSSDDYDGCWIGGEWYCYDCCSTCDDCGDPVRNDDTYHVINRHGDDGYVCEWCRRENYTWCDYDQEYVSDGIVVTTEEGNNYMEGSDGYGNCSRCGECHDIDELENVGDELLCGYCREQMEEENEE